jgi:nucleotide-binding universal stress UspA family protein
MNESTPVRGDVVVGVDGSKASTDALRWAVRYARMAGTTVRVVTAWYFPASYGWAPTPLIAEVDLEADARLAQKQVLEEVVALEGPVTVQTEIVQGPPALMLLRAAADADLLVVGSRGHGAFAGMLLGSVSEHCVHHATCPVVVVHHDGQPRWDDN